MNLMFHVAALAAIAALIYWLLKMQRQRDMLRQLLRVARSGEPDSRGKVVVAEPRRFLRRYAESLGLAFADECQGPDKPQRIELGALADLFLRTPLSLIRCEDTGEGNWRLTINLAASTAPANAADATNFDKLRRDLETALGVKVLLGKRELGEPKNA